MFPDTFTVIVKAHASKSQLLERVGDPQGFVYRIAISAPAKDGKANKELLRFLGKMSGRSAEIISGATSKKKLIRLT